MKWDVEYTDEFAAWWNTLDDAEQRTLGRDVDLLESLGPGLGRPQVDTVKGSRFSNMKELRTQHRGDPYRVLFAFDPRRCAILLIGGNKAGDKRWYSRFVPLADRLYEEYLEELRQEGLI